MTSIAGSNAVHDRERILSQHQSALTLLNGLLQNPAVKSVHWLDIACGKGQIIAQLDENLSPEHRAKLSYVGYDINSDFTRTAEKLAEGLGLQEVEFLHGDLSSFSKLVSSDRKFDFISCTNTAHEIQPGCFACLFLDALLRLSESGELFIYDMESLMTPELGALPWRKEEIDELINAAFDTLGTAFRAHPSTWKHSTVRGWSVTIQRHYIDVTNETIVEKRNELSERLEGIIDQLLDSRLKECNKVLEAFCKYGTETAQDENDKVSALYEFWALHRAKGMRS